MAQVSDLVPVLTSNTAPSGEASASVNSKDAWKLFDSDEVWTVWVSVSAPAWVQYEFASATVCDAYSISASDTWTSWTPNTWTLEASNTGAFAGEEVVLDTQTGISTWASREKKGFLFTNSTAYTHYRIDITAAQGGYIQIPNVEFGEELKPSGTVTGEATVLSPAPLGTTITGAATVSADGQLRTNDYSLLFVQEIELSKVSKTFTFVEKIEQLPSATIIVRINS